MVASDKAFGKVLSDKLLIRAEWLKGLVLTPGTMIEGTQLDGHYTWAFDTAQAGTKALPADYATFVVLGR